MKPIEWALAIIFICLIAALFVWGISSHATAQNKHNDALVAECRKLGGFAHTRSDGWLKSCTFPNGASK